MHDPTAYFAAALRAAFAEEGIEIARRRIAPAHGPLAGEWELLATHESDLARTLEVTNKRSQNFYAESLAKLLGWKVRGEGSWSAGVCGRRRFPGRARHRPRELPPGRRFGTFARQSR